MHFSIGNIIWMLNLYDIIILYYNEKKTIIYLFVCMIGVPVNEFSIMLGWFPVFLC